MLVTKLFEIRDRQTFVPCLATLVVPAPFFSDDTPSEHYLAKRAGYNTLSDTVLFGRLDTPKLLCNPEEWNDRTMQVAHDFVQTNWDQLTSGSVIDVEFVLGESSKPKESERTGPLEPVPF